jgi:hypothetical protein
MSRLAHFDLIVVRDPVDEFVVGVDAGASRQLIDDNLIGPLLARDLFLLQV